MSGVSDLLMVSNGAITALVQKLEAEQILIHREVSLEDRRTFRLRVVWGTTPEFGRMARRREEWVIALVGELSPVAQSDLAATSSLCSSAAWTSTPDEVDQAISSVPCRAASPAAAAPRSRHAKRAALAEDAVELGKSSAADAEHKDVDAALGATAAPCGARPP